MAIIPYDAHIHPQTQRGLFHKGLEEDTGDDNTQILKECIISFRPGMLVKRNTI